jgi:hypothetical protein
LDATGPRLIVDGVLKGEVERRTQETYKEMKGSMGNIEEPLLPKKQYPNCGACKWAPMLQPDAGIPYKEFFYLFLLVLVNCKHLLLRLSHSCSCF